MPQSLKESGGGGNQGGWVFFLKGDSRIRTTRFPTNGQQTQFCLQGKLGLPLVFAGSK